MHSPFVSLRFQFIMSKILLIIVLLVIVCIISISFTYKSGNDSYVNLYDERLNRLNKQQEDLVELIRKSDIKSAKDIEEIKIAIAKARRSLKGIDFWVRYLDPIAYKKMNGPLPVEWETEVFEKFEKPYKREGAGLTLAQLYLDENELSKDSLISLIQSSIIASETYTADSITGQLRSHQHFYLCNRLFLLNLAAIYTTGFECPDTASIIPELINMLKQTKQLYTSYNKSFPTQSLQ